MACEVVDYILRKRFLLERGCYIFGVTPTPIVRFGNCTIARVTEEPSSILFNQHVLLLGDVEYQNDVKLIKLCVHTFFNYGFYLLHPKFSDIFQYFLLGKNKKQKSIRHERSKNSPEIMCARPNLFALLVDLYFAFLPSPSVRS